MKTKNFSALKHMRIFPKCLIALAIAVFCLLPARNVQARDYNSENQTAQTQTSVTITWEASSEPHTDYKLYIGADYSSVRDSAPIATIPASETRYTINNLKPGTEYYVQLVYTKEGAYLDSTAVDDYIATLPGKVTGVKQDRWWQYAKSVDAVWDEMTAAEGYEYEFKNSKNKKIASGTCEYNRQDASIQNNMIYTLRVRAYSVIKGQKYYGDWSDTAYLFTQPEVTKLSISGGKLKVNWKKVSGATGYEVWASTKQHKGFKKVATLKKANASSATIKKLQKKSFSTKKTYYVYVVAMKKVGKRTYKTGVNYVSPIEKGKYQSGLYYK